MSSTNKSYDELRLLKIKFERLQNQYIEALDENGDAIKSMEHWSRLVKLGAKGSQKKYREAQERLKITEKNLQKATEEYEKVIEEINNTEGIEIVDSSRMSLEDYNNLIENIKSQNKEQNNQQEQNKENKEYPHTKMKDDDLIHMYS